MFPDLDKDIIDDVVREKQGRCVVPSYTIYSKVALANDLISRVGLAVDACLALSA